MPIFQERVKGTAEAQAIPTFLKSVASAPYSGPTVAVMPLINLSGDRQQEYFTKAWRRN